MPPKAKSNAAPSTRIAIKGVVAGAPDISKMGSAVRVTKTLKEGAEIEEIFPKRRLRGKQMNYTHSIPAEEVVRLVDEAMLASARATRQQAKADSDKQAQMVNDLANKFVAAEQDKTAKEKQRTKFAKEKLAAARKQNVVAQKARRDPAGVISSIASALNIGGSSSSVPHPSTGRDISAPRTTRRSRFSKLPATAGRPTQTTLL